MMAKRETSTKGLGRGLAALLGDAATLPVTPTSGLSKADIRTVPVDALEPGPFQPRTAIADEPLEELTASIRERGILQPLLVRPHPATPGKYQIIAGERRWRAAQAVPLHELPVYVRDLNETEAAAAALVENLQRADLNPIEEAEGLRRLVDTYALTHEDLGRMLGKSRSHISNTLRLLTLPPSVQAYLRAGRLTAGHARALLASPDPAALAEQVVAKGLNVRQTERLAIATTRPPRTLEPRDPNLDTLERDLQDRLGLSVQIRASGTGGELRIRYKDLDQLDALLALLMRSH